MGNSTKLLALRPFSASVSSAKRHLGTNLFLQAPWGEGVVCGGAHLQAPWGEGGVCGGGGGGGTPMDRSTHQHVNILLFLPLFLFLFLSPTLLLSLTKHINTPKR